MRLLVVRHGATLNNASGRYTGQSDAGLSPLGIRQAEALSERLAGQHFDCIVTSDLLRARETAERIAGRHHDTPLIADPDLREVSMGAWEGLTHAEAMTRDPGAMEQWTADPCTFAPPGGETLTALRDRLARALDHWTQTHPNGTVLWVTHGGAVGVLLCHALGLDLGRRLQFRRDNAAITELAVGDGAMLIVRHNDTAHLEHLRDDDLAEPSQVL